MNTNSNLRNLQNLRTEVIDLTADCWNTVIDLTGDAWNTSPREERRRLFNCRRNAEIKKIQRIKKIKEFSEFKKGINLSRLGKEIAQFMRIEDNYYLDGELTAYTHGGDELHFSEKCDSYDTKSVAGIRRMDKSIRALNKIYLNNSKKF